MKHTLAILSAVCLIGFIEGAAHAQQSAAATGPEWMSDRRYTEGIGIRVGDLELHPGAGAELGYDSNYFHRGPNDFGGPVGALRLRITPSFSISTLSPQRREAQGVPAPPPDVELRGGVFMTGHMFFPVSGPADGQELMKEQHNLSFGADAELTVLPNRPWSGRFFVDGSRTPQPTNQGYAEGDFDRNRVGGGGELIFAPGGGLLDWRLGYGFHATVFDEPGWGFNHLDHQVQTRGRWRFLPRTALMYDARLGFVTYPQDGTPKTGSHPVRTLLGLNGLITPSFGVTALAGWGASFYEQGDSATEPEDFDSVIGRAELKWYLTPNPSTNPMQATLSLSSIAVGFVRDFYDSYLGTYFELDRGYLSFSYMFAGRFLLVAEGGGAAKRYPKLPQFPSSDAFTNGQVDASLFGEYRFSDRLGVNLTGKYTQELSGTSLQDPATGGKDELKWQQFEAYLGLRFFM